MPAQPLFIVRQFDKIGRRIVAGELLEEPVVVPQGGLPQEFKAEERSFPREPNFQQSDITGNGARMLDEHDYFSSGGVKKAMEAAHERRATMGPVERRQRRKYCTRALIYAGALLAGVLFAVFV